MARVNQIPNPSFRNGTLDWVGVNGATIAVAEGHAFYGSDSMQVTKAAVNGSGIETQNYIPIAALLSEAASAYINVPVTIPASETAPLELKIRWFTVGLTFLSESVSAIISEDPSNEWDRLSIVANAPAGAAFAKLNVTQVGVGTAGQIFYVDAFLLEQASFVGGFLENLTQAQENQIVNKSLTPMPDAIVTGIPLNADVTLNDLVFNTVDENNVVWICTDLDGWWGQSSPDIPDIPRGVEDGSYDVTGRYQARIINLSGTFLPPSPDYVSAARDRLVAATNLVRTGAWLRTNENPTRAAFVRLSGQPKIVTVNARGRTDFVIGLRAADPIRYEWNDADPDGLTTVVINGVSGGATGTVVNDGSSDVTATFELEGPLGNGSTVYNSATNETITLIQALRGNGSVGTITNKVLTSGVATLTCTAPTNLVIGDLITVAGAGAPFDTINETVEVSSVSDISPWTVSYLRNADDVVSIAAGGQISLAFNDVLDVDTYERSVTFNGSTDGNRSKIETLVDWIKLAPGSNPLTFLDSIDSFQVVGKALTTNIVTLTTAAPHYLDPGDTITVALPASADLANKALASNVVTLTTKAEHGYAVGDTVVVSSSTIQNIVNKQLVSNVVTLTTDTVGGFAVADTAVVAMPTVGTIIAKNVTTNVATLTTALAHGFSIGDSITVVLPTTATPVTKVLTSNVATLTMSAAHNFSVGDSITVTMPASSTITNKATSGSTVTMTTTAAHNLSVGDKVLIALPTAISLGTTRAWDPSTYRITIPITAASGFSVGDSITFNSGFTGVATVSNRSATTTQCTLTIPTGHGMIAGEDLTVTGVGTRYNGAFFIDSVTATTVTYTFAGAAEASTAATGSVRDNTIADGYNGTHYLDAVTGTTLQWTYFGRGLSATAGTLTSPTLVNNTDVLLNGTVTVTAVGSSTTFSYTEGV